MKKFFIVLVFLLVLALIGVVALHNGPQIQALPGTDIASTDPSINPKRRDGASSMLTPSPIIPKPQPAVKTLQASFTSASSLYAFANYAKQFPEQGGMLYAYSLARTCSGFLGSLANKPAGSTGVRDDAAELAKRQSAIGKIYQKCDGFAADTTQDSILKDVYANIKAASSDPYLSARANPTEAIKLLGTTRDPYLLESLLVAAMPPVIGAADTGYYFDGTLLTGADGELLGMARGLAACNIGTGCNATEDLELIQNCAFGGICADSRESLYKQIIANSNINGGEERLFQYRDKIIKAVNDHNYSVFTAKK